MTERPNQYLWNPEEEAELARLVDQANQYNKIIEDLLPPSIDPSAVSSILDIGCGPGGWATSVAQTYPHVRVTGIGISQLMIAYADAQARVQGIKNVEFLVMDILEPSFPSRFDIINMRFGMSF